MPRGSCPSVTTQRRICPGGCTCPHSPHPTYPTPLLLAPMRFGYISPLMVDGVPTLGSRNRGKKAALSEPMIRVNTSETHVFSEVLHGVLYPEAHRNRFQKKTMWLPPALDLSTVRCLGLFPTF